MKLKDLGEFNLIRRFASHWTGSILPAQVEGIGDDCAVIPKSDGNAYLVTTDLLIENVHFLKSKISPQDLGYKALAVNLSDIAAMGGMPLYAFLSLALPPDLDVSWIDAFFDGFNELAAKEHVFLLGGDTTRSLSDITINVLVVGEISLAHIKRRSNALPGDIICCTGHLGSSGAGLRVLLQDLPLNAITLPLVQEHHRPRPHLKEGQWLAKQQAVHAMIDISDGISSDIQHIAEQSDCGAMIDLDALPMTAQLSQAASSFGWNPQELALSAGEDYSLLLTVAPQIYDQLQKDFFAHFHQPLFKIGTIIEQKQIVYRKNQQPISISFKGFDHFHS